MPVGVASFPIVGVGASTGGVEAFAALLRALPAAPGMSFVYVSSRDAGDAEPLATLAAATRMPVHEIRGETRVERDRVYLAPAGGDVVLMHGVLSPLARPPEGSVRGAVDTFFRSLAADRGERAIGVVLSGAGSDGTRGLLAIKEAGGLTLAQHPEGARALLMPASAIGAGAVDLVRSPAAIARELVRLRDHPYLSDKGDAEGAPWLKRILARIRTRTRVDFSEYSPEPTRRRIERRMAVLGVAGGSAYLRLLQDRPSEIDELVEELLFDDAQFFRDPEAFEALGERVLQPLAEARTPDRTVRVWAAGCASGEEAYSLAILWLEIAKRTGSRRTLHVFGGDLSARAIAKARLGRYPDGAVRSMSEERVRRFFTRVPGGWQVTNEVRELCVFARHDLARDPPISHLDLIVCRDVLSRFGEGLRERALRSFHFALRESGFLALGKGEQAGGELFLPADSEASIHLRAPGPAAIPVLGTRRRGARRPGGAVLHDLALQDELRAVKSALVSHEAESARALARTERARADLESANKAKDLFLAVVSHELRTPLNTLMMQAALLKRPNLDPGTVHQHAEIIERAARTQSRLIEDLLDMSRIIAGKLRVERQPVAIVPVARAALEAVFVQARLKNVVIDAILDDDSGRVLGDAVRLQQVVWNLLTNAIKFTPSGGRIALKVEPADGHVRIRVRDTGMGIAPEFLPRVFERFAQAEEGSGRSEGLGLGLAIVRHLVEVHGGTIEAESEGQGKGSTFTVLLPRLQPAAKRGARGVRRAAAARKGSRPRS